MSSEQIEWTNNLFHVVGPFADGSDDVYSSLTDQGLTLLHFATIQDYLDEIHTKWSFFPVAVLVDSSQWTASDHEALQAIQTIRPELKIVIINSDPETIPEQIFRACMYLKAPFDASKLMDVVSGLLRCHISVDQERPMCASLDDRKAFNLKAWTCPHPCSSCSDSSPAY